MSEPVATLIVGGEPDDWWEEWAPDGMSVVARRNTVRIDGPLPIVNDMTADEHDEAIQWRDWQSIQLAHRPLRVDDRVTLATECDCCDCACGPPHPFATATVVEVRRPRHWDESGHGQRWLVTVTDVEGL